MSYGHIIQIQQALINGLLCKTATATSSLRLCAVAVSGEKCISNGFGMNGTNVFYRKTNPTEVPINRRAYFSWG